MRTKTMLMCVFITLLLILITMASPSMYNIQEYPSEEATYEDVMDEPEVQGAQHIDFENNENDVELEDQEETYDEEYDNGH